MMVGLAGCGTPDPHRHHTRPVSKPKSTEPMNASADRAHPAAMAETHHSSFDGGELDVRTPTAGSWWFELTVSPVREGMVVYGVATVVLTADVSRRDLTVDHYVR